MKVRTTLIAFVSAVTTAGLVCGVGVSAAAAGSTPSVPPAAHVVDGFRALVCSKADAAVTDVQDAQAKLDAVRFDVDAVKAQLTQRIADLEASLADGGGRSNLAARIQARIDKARHRFPQLDAKIARWQAKLLPLEAKVQALLPQIQAQLPTVQASVPELPTSLRSIQSKLPSLGTWLQNLLPNLQTQLPQIQTALQNAFAQLQALLPQLQAQISQAIPQLDGWIQSWCSANTTP